MDELEDLSDKEKKSEKKVLDKNNVKKGDKDKKVADSAAAGTGKGNSKKPASESKDKKQKAEVIAVAAGAAGGGGGRVSQRGENEGVTEVGQNGVLEVPSSLKQKQQPVPPSGGLKREEDVASAVTGLEEDLGKLRVD